MVKRTLIGVITSHDDKKKNDTLVKLLTKFVTEKADLLEHFTFVFTGGTFDRVILGKKDEYSTIEVTPVEDKVRDALLENCGIIRLPRGSEGGVIILTNLILRKYISILWFFLSPSTAHWLSPDNLALSRLCDEKYHLRIKKLMNYIGIDEWINKSAHQDINLNPKIEWPPNSLSNITINKLIHFKAPLKEFEPEKGDDILNKLNTKLELWKQCYQIKTKSSEDTEITEPENNIALIAHDEMKEKMRDFVLLFESELSRYDNIITTGTTGKFIEQELPNLKKKKKISPQLSGPRGGDIQIAALILFNKIKDVVFLVDPLSPLAHIDDVRTVFKACMIHGGTRIFTNEIQARLYFEYTLRGK